MSTGSGFGQTVVSGVLDWGYPGSAAWVDGTGSGMKSFCRLVGSENQVSSYLRCNAFTGGGFGPDVNSGVVDWGWPAGRAWVDADGDGKADFCRVVGATNQTGAYARCTLSTGSGFGAEINSGALDWGTATARAWVDVDGDGKTDFCRPVGSVNQTSSYLRCNLSTGSGFGVEVNSGVVDWGAIDGRAWAKVTGDRASAYCRRVGSVNHESSCLRCNAFTGTGFGPDINSGVVDWGWPDY